MARLARNIRTWGRSFALHDLPMKDWKFLWNRYARNRKITSDGLLWTYPGKKNWIIYHEEDFLNDVILHKSGGTFLDVGANVGAWSIRASPYYYRVVSIEPSPECYNALLRNIRLNHASNIHAYRLALDNFYGRENEVSIRPLDAFFPDKQGFAVMKVDVEGAAYGVIQGALGNILRDHPTIIVEVHNVLESKIPGLLPSYQWERRFRAIHPTNLWLYREDDQQVFLIGRPDHLHNLYQTANPDGVDSD